MPDVDGWQFLDALNPMAASINERCRIYVLSTSIHLPDRNKAKKHPLVFDLWVKPISDEHIEMLNHMGSVNF